MARTLDSLESGTPVYAGETRIGSVRAAYTEGSSRAVELLVIHHDARDEEVAIAASDVESVDDAGVHLMGMSADDYRNVPRFDAARFPTMKQLT